MSQTFLRHFKFFLFAKTKAGLKYICKNLRIVAGLILKKNISSVKIK